MTNALKHQLDTCQRSTALFWIACGLLLFSTAAAWAQTSFRACAQDVRTRETLQCTEVNLEEDVAINAELVPWEANLTPAASPHLTCRFQFWTFDGSFFTTDQLPREVTVPAGTAGKATAWFVCSGGTCQEPPCPFDTDVYAIDASSSDWVAQPFIEEVDPVFAAGTCFSNSPCHTTANMEVDSLTAKAVVGRHEFVSWFGQSTGSRTRRGPLRGGLQIALYRTPGPDPCALIGLTSDGPCEFVPPDAILDIDLERPSVTELDRLCHLVLNCPGCGPFGLCAPFGWRFEGEGIERLQVLLHERKTGKVLAKGKQLADGSQLLEFTPEKGEFERYFLSFMPNGKAGKLKRGKLRVKLDISPKF